MQVLFVKIDLIVDEIWVIAPRMNIFSDLNLIMIGKMELNGYWRNWIGENSI